MTYTIEKSGITLDFSTWAFEKFCERNGNLTVTDMGMIFSQLTPAMISSLILCGAENHHRRSKSKEPFEFTNADAADWIDDMGGLSGQGFSDCFLAIAKSMNPQYQGVEIIEEKAGDEKKSQLAGTNTGLTVSELA